MNGKRYLRPNELPTYAVNTWNLPAVGTDFLSSVLEQEPSRRPVTKNLTHRWPMLGPEFTEFTEGYPYKIREILPCEASRNCARSLCPPLQGALPSRRGPGSMESANVNERVAFHFSFHIGDLPGMKALHLDKEQQRRRKRR